MLLPLLLRPLYSTSAAILLLLLPPITVTTCMLRRQTPFPSVLGICGVCVTSQRSLSLVSGVYTTVNTVWVPRRLAYQDCLDVLHWTQLIPVGSLSIICDEYKAVYIYMYVRLSGSCRTQKAYQRQVFCKKINNVKCVQT